MSRNPQLRNIAAWALVVVFLAGWSLKTIHGLLLHHNHSAGLDCSIVFGKHSGHHIHDERYSKDSCSLCDFVLSASEVLSITAVLHRSVELGKSDSFPNLQQPVKSAHDTTCLRGPPTVF